MYPSLRTKTLIPESNNKSSTETEPKLTAVWLDHKAADIFYIEDGTMTSDRVESELPPKGRSNAGSATGQPLADNGPSSEHNDNRWREEIMKKYFKKVTAAIKGSDRIVLMGPGQTKINLHHTMQSNKSLITKLDPEPLTVERMTEGQLKALVRDYFKIA